MKLKHKIILFYVLEMLIFAAIAYIDIKEGFTFLFFWHGMYLVKEYNRNK